MTTETSTPSTDLLSVAMVTLGCARNEVDSEELAGRLEAGGFRLVDDASEADTVRRALRGGIVHYLMKPFSYDDLRVRLEHYQQAYAAMAGEHTDQADVDRVFGVSGADKRLPKGFSAETLRLVEDTLRQETADVSAAEAASLLGISRVSARRYLEHLAETGKVEVALRYGEVGRPERRYAWR